MHWGTLLLGVLKGIVEVLADEYRLLAKRRAAKRAPAKKEAPPEPTMGWGDPSPPSPVTLIRIDTDEGSRVAAASFVGSEYFGQKKVEKVRQPGESRRTRRKVREEDTRTSASPCPSTAETPASRTDAVMQPAVASTSAPTSEVMKSEAPARATRSRRAVLELSTTTLATLARGAA